MEAEAVSAEGTSHPIAFPNVQTRRVRWRIVFWKLLRFALHDYVRSFWPLVNLLLLVGVHSLFFNYRSDQSHFFTIEYATIALLAAINAYAVFSRANRAETYAILARPVPRASYTGALMLVAWLATLFFHVISTLAEAIRFSQWLNPELAPMPWREPLTYLNGSLPIVVVALAVVGFMALISSFVSGSGVRLLVLALVALSVMSFDSDNFPIEEVRPYLERMPPVLAPAAGALKYATETPPDDVAVISLALLAGYAVALVLLALWLAPQRELVLD